MASKNTICLRMTKPPFWRRKGTDARIGRVPALVIDLVDGTCELFRYCHGLRRFPKGDDRPYGAVVGVLNGARRPRRHSGRRTTRAWTRC